MSFRQKAGDGKGKVCNMVDIYYSATNRFLNLWNNFSSSRTRASELLTAKSALACVQVPMGAIFWEDMDFGHLQVTMRALDMCPYFDFHNMRWDLTLVLWTNQNVFWTQTFSYCLITLAAYKPLCCVLSLPDSWMRLEDIFSFLPWADLEYIVESEAIYIYLPAQS